MNDIELIVVLWITAGRERVGRQRPRARVLAESLRSAGVGGGRRGHGDGPTERD